MHLRKHVKEENVQRFRKLIEELVETLKIEDPLFKKSFRTIFYASSCYWKNDSCESQPNEIDVHLQMQFPIKEDQIQAKRSKCNDWIHLKLKQPIGETSMQRKCRHLLPQMTTLFDDEKNMYMLRVKVNEWLKEALDKALENIIHRKHPSEIEFRRSRVSKNLMFKSKIGNELLYVNIVAAIGIPHSTLLTKTQKSVCPDQVMLLCKEPPSSSGERSFANQLFRVFIPKAEEKTKASKENSKALQQMYKDTEWPNKWDFLTSYYLQMLLLWQLQYGSVVKLEKSSLMTSWNEVFSKMVVDFIDDIEFEYLFLQTMFNPFLKVRLLQKILREAQDSPYEVAENILSELRSLCN